MAEVRQTLLMHPALTAVELEHGSGMILATRLPEHSPHSPA